MDDVVVVLQPLFTANQRLFLKNYPVFGFVFSAEKSERLGGSEVLRKVRRFCVDILLLVADRFLVILKGT